MHGPDAFPVYFAEVYHKLSANDEVAGKTHCILVFYLGVNVLYLHVLGFSPRGKTQLVLASENYCDFTVKKGGKGNKGSILVLS